MTLAPRAVLVHRRTELEELLARHGTRGQAAFFLSTRGRDLAEIDARHAAQQRALAEVSAAVPVDWRRGAVERDDLDRFLFAPDDIVVIVGQDGLVANVAKYLDGQPVIGIDPDPGRNPGVLVPHPPQAAAPLLAAAVSGATASGSTASGNAPRNTASGDTASGDTASGDTAPLVAAPGATASHVAAPRAAMSRVTGSGTTVSAAGRRVQARTMVEAVSDDGQRLLALNEIYLGHPGHQTARYTLRTADGRTERQGSSGILVGTGTGATGWCRSAWLERRSSLPLPGLATAALCWFVREAWPSPMTGTDLTEGILDGPAELTVTVESDRLIAFGDGIEADNLTLGWGQTAILRVASQRLHLLV